jgi:hypothetical protein
MTDEKFNLCRGLPSPTSAAPVDVATLRDLEPNQRRCAQNRDEKRQDLIPQLTRLDLVIKPILFLSQMQSSKKPTERRTNPNGLQHQRETSTTRSGLARANTKAACERSAPRSGCRGKEGQGRDSRRRNGDGFITADDLIIWFWRFIQWVVSWRSGMLLSVAFTVGAVAININSWTAATGSFAAGFVTWGVIQTLELMPAFDSFNMKANIAALIRFQRKPVESADRQRNAKPWLSAQASKDTKYAKRTKRCCLRQFAGAATPWSLRS